jgi:outer membrane lipoprotein-sorting protein
MKSPIVKLAAAAVIIAVVVLGLFEFVKTENKSGVVWADVAKKVEASRGLILRCRETSSFLSNEDDYSIKYFSPTHSRTDTYKGGQITQTYYKDLETKTSTFVNHTHKHYMSRTFTPSEQGFLEKHADWMNAKYLVETILSCEHRIVGQKTIEGVLCEGIETTDPGVLGPLPGPVSRLDVEMRLWVDAKTEYPALFEAKIHAEAEGKTMSSECVMDQFQWDVELEPNLFEPNIPPDYTDIRKL